MNQQPARRAFRIGAYAVALFCFVCAGLSPFAPADMRMMLAAVCLFVGFVMFVIATTGYWPPRQNRTP